MPENFSLAAEKPQGGRSSPGGLLRAGDTFTDDSEYLVSVSSSPSAPAPYPKLSKRLH